MSSRRVQAALWVVTSACFVGAAFAVGHIALWRWALVVVLLAVGNNAWDEALRARRKSRTNSSVSTP